MSLTFRSSAPEARVFIEREPDGRQCVCRAERHHGDRQWRLSLEHPDGQQWGGSFTGDVSEVPLAMARMLDSRENEFKQARARGDRRPQPKFDYNMPVDFDPQIAGHIRNIK